MESPHCALLTWYPVGRGRTPSPPPRRLKANAHPFAGFERPPEGCLFDQAVDFSQSMGFAYERSLGFYKSMHVHDRALFVFPRGGSSMRVGVPSLSPRRFNLTSADGLVVPAGLEHDDQALSSVYDTFALFPSEELLASACQAADAPVEAFASCAVFRRSPWLEALLEEYFAECILRRRGGEGLRP